MAIMETAAPAAWASALVNGDFSGLTTVEAMHCSRWIEMQRPWHVVDVKRTADGEGEEPRFSKRFAMLAGTNELGLCGDVLTYVLHKLGD